MKILVITLSLVQMALCVDLDKLPTAASLIAGAKRPCGDFIATRPDSVCHKYGAAPNEKTVFFQLFDAPAAGISFNDAQAECQSKGGFLATFHDEAQYNAVKMAIFPDLAAGDLATILLGIKADDDSAYQNQDMITTTVPGILRPTPLGTAPTCVGVSITGVDTMPDTDAIAGISCGATPSLIHTQHYMCRFNYISNSIVYIDEKADWFMAMTKCQEIGGELLSLKNNDEKAVVNCLLAERAKHEAWIGLNDLTEEGHFSWSDYSIAKFTPFCQKPVADSTKDCVYFQSNNVHPDDIDKKTGCFQPANCNSKDLPFICKIRDPESDSDAVLFKEYLVHLLKDVVAAEGVCSGTCGNGLGSIFNSHKKPSSVITRKKVRVVRGKKHGGKGGKRRIKKAGSKSHHKILPRDKKRTSNKKPKQSSSGFNGLLNLIRH